MTDIKGQGHERGGFHNQSFNHHGPGEDFSPKSGSKRKGKSSCFQPRSLAHPCKEQVGGGFFSNLCRAGGDSNQPRLQDKKVKAGPLNFLRNMGKNLKNLFQKEAPPPTPFSHQESRSSWSSGASTPTSSSSPGSQSSRMSLGSPTSPVSSRSPSLGSASESNPEELKQRLASVAASYAGSDKAKEAASKLLENLFKKLKVVVVEGDLEGYSDSNKEGELTIILAEDQKPLNYEGTKIEVAKKLHAHFKKDKGELFLTLKGLDGKPAFKVLSRSLKTVTTQTTSGGGIVLKAPGAGMVITAALGVVNKLKTDTLLNNISKIEEG